MFVNEKKIIEDTKSVFFKSKEQTEKYKSISQWVSEKDYKKIHTSPLVPLDLTFDHKNLKFEIEQFSKYFERWGSQHNHLPRKGLALVNQDGILKQNDPINGSLYEWNLNNPENPILETDCTTPTNVLKIKSLINLNIFNNYWCRSNILIWEDGAKFYPHIDTLIPSPWIRLWATDSNSIKLFFAKNNNLEEFSNIEPGRIYLIDTSIVHSASCVNEPGLQLFLSVLPSAYKTLKTLVLN
jgi:hypothetical protein